MKYVIKKVLKLQGDFIFKNKQKELKHIMIDTLIIILI